MKRPLLPVALAYVAGICLGRWFPLPIAGLFAASFGLAGLTVCWPAARASLLWPLLVLAGWTNLTTRLAVIAPDDLRVHSAGRAELGVARGRLHATPTFRIFEHHEVEAWRTHAVLELTHLRRQEEWLPASGRVAVTTPGALGAEYFAGRWVEVTGVLRAPRGPLAEGLFDYRAFLGWQGIHRQLQTLDTNDWRLATALAQPARPPLPDRFRNWAQAALARGLPAEDQELRLLWAMTLGWRTALTDEVAEPFMRSGTMHIFAISGLHIALISGILVAVLRALRLPRILCGGAVIPLLWFYTAATGWQASAIRATIMMTIIIVGWALKRPGDLLNSLAAAGLIILLGEPTQLFQASFQLSFFVVLSIALLLPSMEKLEQRLLRTDPFLPEELRPRWRRWLDLPIRFFTKNLAISIAAWIGSLPLIAHYFHLFTPGGLLANLLVVPLSGAALASGLGAMTCATWAPALAELFNHSAWFWMNCMLTASHWVNTLPGAFAYVPAPSAPGLAVYYLLLITVTSGWLRRPRWRAGSLIALALLATLWIATELRGRGTNRITILGAGAGATFVDLPGDQQDLLIDSGSESGANHIVKPFLRSRGLDFIPSLLLTHGDQRRIGGFDLIDAEFQPRTIAVSPARSRSPGYRKILTQLEGDAGRTREVRRGSTLAGWEVLHPAAGDEFARADDQAVVLWRELHGQRIVLLSELGEAGQGALLAAHPNLRADIVVAGIPDQGEPLGAELLGRLRPRLILIEDAEYPVTKQASPRLRERLASAGVPVIFLRESGSVTFSLREGQSQVESMNTPRMLLKSIPHHAP